MEKASSSITVHMPEYYDKLLKDLLTSDLKSEPGDIIAKKLAKLFGGYMVNALPVKKDAPDLVVYRVTNFEPPAEEVHLIKHYSYNPNPAIGRANTKGNPVFYCSLSAHTAITEMKELTKVDYYISKWRLKFKNALNIAIIPSDVEQNPKTISSVVTKKINAAQRKIISGIENEQARDWMKYKQEKFNELFTSPGQEFYSYSSAIANMYLNKSSKFGASIPILMYPSTTRNKEDVNLAISKEIADDPECFKLESIIKCHISKKGETEFAGHFGMKGFNIKNRIQWKKGVLEIKNIDLENVKLAFDGQSQEDLYNSRKINILCGQFSGSLYDFLECRKEQLLNSLLSQYDGGLIDNNYLNKSTRYQHSTSLIIMPELDLSSKEPNKTRLSYIGLRVDFVQKFVNIKQ